MKRPREHEVIVRRQFAQTGCELALVDQPTGFIDNCQGEDGPVRGDWVNRYELVRPQEEFGRTC